MSYSLQMETHGDMTARHRRMLAELAEMAMEAARLAREDVRAAETAAERAEAVATLHRASRTARQSMALEERLARLARTAERDEARGAAEDQARAVVDRKAEVRARLREMIWSEAEAPDCKTLVEELDDRLTDAEHLEGFLARDVEAQIAGLRAQLGLEPGVPAARRRTTEQGPWPREITVRFVDPSPGAVLGLGGDNEKVIYEYTKPPPEPPDTG